MNIPQQFASRISVSENGCWNWLGWTNEARGRDGIKPYGMFQLKKKPTLAHRHFFQLATGIDPGSLHVHHKCENTLCVNPDHLELLSLPEHSRHHNAFGKLNADKLARTHCRHGHVWTEENTYVPKSGERMCKECQRGNNLRYRDRNRKPAAERIRPTHCPKGHPYSGDNVYFSPKGGRFCRTCNRERPKPNASTQ